MQSVSDDDVRKDFLKSHILSWHRKVTSSGRAFQVFGPATGKAWLPMVDRLTDALEDEWCLENEAVVCREDCILARAVQAGVVMKLACQ